MKKLQNIINKRNLVIFLLALLVIVMVILLVKIFIGKDKDEYLTTPISQSAVSTSSRKILLKDKKFDIKSEDYYLWEVKSSLQLEKVKAIANNNNLQLGYYKEGYSYHWEKGSNQLLYTLTTNVLTVLGEDIITTDSISPVSSATFSSIVKKYFDLDWEYEIFETEKRDSGETVYYAKRLLNGTSMIEIASHNHQTDYIAVKNNKIVYAKLLLTEFINTKKILPLLSQKELGKYINQIKYPKDVYPKMDILNNDPVFEEIEYVESEYKKLRDSIDNCEVDIFTVIYLYKDVAQKYLTPVYRLDSQCKAKYKDKEYLIPAIVYVNAITPDLITSDTN